MDNLQALSLLLHPAKLLSSLLVQLHFYEGHRCFFVSPYLFEATVIAKVSTSEEACHCYCFIQSFGDDFNLG